VLHAGKILFPSWGNGNAATDLAIAYEKAAAVVLAERPTYLIFAQGLMAGRDLRAVADRPLVLRRKWPDGPVVTNQLAYEVHEYPFLWCVVPLHWRCLKPPGAAGTCIIIKSDQHHRQCRGDRPVRHSPALTIARG